MLIFIDLKVFALYGLAEGGWVVVRALHHSNIEGQARLSAS